LLRMLLVRPYPEQKKKKDTIRYPTGTKNSSPGRLIESGSQVADTIWDKWWNMMITANKPCIRFDFC